MRSAIGAALGPLVTLVCADAAPAHAAISTAKMRFSILLSLCGKRCQKVSVPTGSGRHGPHGGATDVPQNKNPAYAGFRRAKRTIALLAPCTDDFDLDAAVLGAALARLFVGDGLLLALAFGVYAVRLDALRYKIGLHRFGAPYRELLVVGVAADRVGVADRDH